MKITSRPLSDKSMYAALKEITAERNADISTVLTKLFSIIVDIDADSFEAHKDWLLIQLQSVINFVEDPNAR